MLEQNCLDIIRHSDLSEIRSASNTIIIVSGTITTHLRIDGSRTLLTFDVVDRLALPVLLGTTFIDKYIKSIYPAVRKLFRYHFLPVPIRMVQKTNSEAKKNTSDICQLIEEDAALLVTPTRSDLKNIIVSRHIVLMAICETPVLRSTQAGCLIEVSSHPNIAKSRTCMTAKGITDVYHTWHI